MHGNLTFMQLMDQGGWVMWVMFVCSILIVCFALERFIALSKIGAMKSSLAEKIKQFIRQGQIKEAIALCNKNQNFTTRALEVALNASHLPREEMESIFALYRMKLQSILNKYLNLFGTLAFIGPLLGLLGTVLGVIRAFRDLALSGSGGPTIVAAGIAEALVATAAGITVAVSASVLYNFFTARVKSIIQKYDLTCQEVAILVYAGKGSH